MTPQEIKLFSKIDNICSKVQADYQIVVKMGIGTYITIIPTDGVSLEFGGFDYEFERALEDTLQAIVNMKIKKKEK